MKTILIAFFLALLCACSDGGRSERVVVTITDVYNDPSKWGCIGTDWNTIVRLEDQRTARLCGKWGKVGDKMRGCWESGHLDGANNGFRMVCREEP